MANYLTVDGGTTNTRIYLVQNGRVEDSEKLSVGARNGADALKKALRDGINTILERNSLEQSAISQILASGMITSEYGLCKLDHTTLPAGPGELHEAMHGELFPDICPIPWRFIRGVKSLGKDLSECDVMRGEETELMGLLDYAREDALYILPGSHSKHVSIDKSGRITAFKTMMTGEFFAAVMQNTILRDAADFDHNRLVESELLHGFEYCREHGVNESLFKTRILRNIFGAEKENCFSFLLGVVLCDEVKAILDAPEQTVVLGGQKQFREALRILLTAFGEKKIITLPDETVSFCVSLGAVRIYENK